MRHGGQQVVQLNAPTAKRRQNGKLNIVMALQTVFNGAASLSGVLKTVLLNDSEIQTATVKRIAAGDRELPAQIENIIYVVQ